MRYVLRHVFIFFFIIELGVIAMIYNPVTEARAQTRISSDVAKSVSTLPSVDVTRFPTAEERAVRARKFMQDLAAGAEASGLDTALNDAMAFVVDQTNALIVSAPPSSQ